MNVELDSREVLMHLNELGYYNITPEQLEEFIKDLKKLIKYDTIKKKLVAPNQLTPDSTSSTLPNTTDESGSPSPPPPVAYQRKQHMHHHSGQSQRGDSGEASSTLSELSAPPARRIFRECTKLGSQKSQEKENISTGKCSEAAKLPAKNIKPCDCMWRRIGCKCCDANWSKEQDSIKTKSKENLAPPRPKSSFIRTWQVTGQPRPGSATQRSDPVTLYHQYQRVWKQQKLPGENNHNDLRWSIRERMLGQDLQPRPLSQASSVTSVSRRQKRL